MRPSAHRLAAALDAAARGEFPDADGAIEVAIEIQPSRRNQGVARQALTEARRLVGSDGLLFAQTAPGNAASIRTFLTAGFRPIGSEVLFVPEPEAR
jgi:RimJ/RimL family protein N-acetyltransferase